MRNDPNVSDMDYIRGPVGGPGMTVQGLPLMKPPWGRITAIDLNRGEIVWQVAHGETPDSVKAHPALQGIDIPRTGRQGPVGTLTTRTLLISGEGGRQAADGGFITTPDGPARRHAAGVRQGHRRERRRGLHAGAADRHADDLPARRPAVPRRGGRRPRRTGRAAGVRAAGGGLTRLPAPARHGVVLTYFRSVCGPTSAAKMLPSASALMPEAPEMRFTSASARSGSGMKARSEPSSALPMVMPRT